MAGVPRYSAPRPRNNSLARTRGNIFRFGPRVEFRPRPKRVRTAAAVAGPNTGSGTGSWTFAGTGVGDDGTVKLRANALGNNGLGSSATTDIVIPADAATDGTDYAVVTISVINATITSAPIGWDLLLGPTAVSFYNAYLYGKTIEPGEPGTTATWTLVGSTVAPGHMAVYRNVNPTGILVGTPTVDTTSGVTLAIPTVASVPAGALFHVHFADINDNTPPASLSGGSLSGYTAGASSRSAASASFKNAVEAVYKVATSAGSYGGGAAQFDSAFMRGVVYAVALPNASTKSGSGTGTWTFAGTGSGTRAPQGSGSGAWSFAGAGSGIAARSGSGSGTWAFTGAGTGTTVRSGTGAGTWTFTGAGTGAFVAQGTGSGTWTWVGAGSGVAPVHFDPITTPVTANFASDGTLAASFASDGASAAEFTTDGSASAAFTDDGVGAASFA